MYIFKISRTAVLNHFRLLLKTMTLQDSFAYDDKLHTSLNLFHLQICSESYERLEVHSAYEELPRNHVVYLSKSVIRM